MRLSNEKRLQDLNRALRLLMDDVGEQWIRRALIQPESDAYKAVSETTWVDLKGQYLIQDAEDGRVHLTGHGWEVGLRLAGRGTLETREKLERICKSIKSAVACRPSLAAGSPVSLGRVASHTGLHAGFVANVIDARLIDSWLNRRGAGWAPGSEGRMILVPLDFAEEMP